MRKPVITILISSLGLGGAQVVMLRLQALLIQAGYTVHLAVFFDLDQDSFFTLGANDHMVGGKIDDLKGVKGKFRLIKNLRKQLKQTETDILISAMPSTNCIALLATQGLQVKSIITEHMDPAHDDDITKVWVILRCFLYPLCAHLVGVSKGVTAHFKTIPKYKKSTIYNLVNIPDIGIDFNLRSSSKTFLCLGRFVPRKGFADAIEAFARTNPAEHAWVLKVYGEGREHKNLLDLIAQYNLQGRVFLLPSERNIDKIYSDSACVLFPSYAEGLGNIILEAMARKRPVIAYDCNYGPSDIIQNGKTGYLVPVGDKAALTERMLEMIKNPTKGLVFGEASYTYFMNNFSSEKILSDWESLFRKVSDGRRY